MLTKMNNGGLTPELEKERRDLLNANVTVVPSCTNSNKLFSYTFGAVLKGMATNENVQRMREMAGWKHSRKKEKEDLFSRFKTTAIPAFTLSTYAKEGETLRDLSEEPRNGFIIIDIDYSTLEEANEEAFKKINSLPFVLGSSKSVSGLGFWSVVKVNIENIHSKKDWQKMYKELYSIYEEHEIDIDRQCGNINRLRCSSPYEFCWNDSFENAYEPLLQEDEEPKKTNEQKNISYEIGWWGREFVETYVSGDNHYRRLEWASTIVSIFGEDGEDLYYHIFSDDPNKNNDVTNTWKWCIKNKATCRTSSYCLGMLMKYGWTSSQSERIDENIEIDNNEYDF